MSSRDQVQKQKRTFYKREDEISSKETDTSDAQQGLDLYQSYLGHPNCLPIYIYYVEVEGRFHDASARTALKL